MTTNTTKKPYDESYGQYISRKIFGSVITIIIPMMALFLIVYVSLVNSSFFNTYQRIMISLMVIVIVSLIVVSSRWGFRDLSSSKMTITTEGFTPPYKSIQMGLPPHISYDEVVSVGINTISTGMNEHIIGVTLFVRLPMLRQNISSPDNTSFVIPVELRFNDIGDTTMDSLIENLAAADKINGAAIEHYRTLKSLRQSRNNKK